MLMNKLQIRIFILFFILCFVSSVTAKNCFVSKSGSNSNSGTIEKPFKTIQFAINQLKNGEKCYVREGVYREKVTFFKSGKRNQPLYLLNYKNETVTIAPRIVNKKWRLFKKNIYRIPWKSNIYQLFINGKPTMQACFPNIIEGDMNTNSWGDMIAYPDKTVILKGLSKFSNLKKCHFIGLHTKGLVSINGDIVDQKDDEITLKNDGFYWDEKFKNNYLGRGKGFITGSLQFLDHPGEWFFDGNYLYLWSSNGYPNKLQITIRENIYNLITDYKSNIIIKGVNLFGCSFSAKNTKNISFLNGQILFPTPFFHPKSGFDITGGEGVEISGSNNKIQNCYIAHSWGNGLTIKGNNHTIKNCIIYDCDWMAIDCAPLYALGKNHSISHNTFSRSARSVLVLGDFEHGKISFNEISESGILCDDLGLLYCYYNDGKQTQISYNWFHDNHAPYYGSGIYLDNGHKNFNVHHNVVWNCFLAMSINEPCENDIIAHNTFFQNKYSMSCWPQRKTGNLNIRTYNNLTDSKLKSSIHQDFHGSIKDSNFVCDNIYIHLQDPNDHLFNLKDNSTLIDKGVIYKKPFPFRNKRPDIGAYENGKESWIAGSNLKISNLLYSTTSYSEYNTIVKKPYIEFYCTLIFFVLLLVILKRWKFIHSSGLKIKTIYFLFSIKVLFGFILFCVYKYYYLNTNTADIFKYFDDAKILHHYIFENSPSDYFKFIFGFKIDTPNIQEALLHTKHWVNLPNSQILNDNQSIIKLHAITLLFSFGFFHIHTIFFCFISFIGCIFIYKTFKLIFPSEINKLIIGIFLVPSVLFWSSGGLKESILIFGIGLLLYHCSKIINKESKPFISIIMILIGFYIILTLKIYVILAMLPSIISWYIIKKMKFKIQISVFLVIHITYILTLFNIYHFIPSFNFKENLIVKQIDLKNVANEMHAKSKIYLPSIERNSNSLISNLPNALSNAFFQPKFNRISSPLLLFVFIENLFVIFLIILLFLFFKKPTKNQRPLIWFSLFYTITLSILVGWIVPISGAISRYKTPILPFLVVSLLICIDYNKIKLILIKSIRKASYLQLDK